MLYHLNSTLDGARGFQVLYRKRASKEGHMQMSEFIDRCQKLLEEHGDLEVEDARGEAVDIEYLEDGDEHAPSFVIK